MTYDVKWIQSALDDLTNIWTAADSDERRRLTSAVNILDRNLERDPHGFGESRDPGEWICFADPLGALVEIDDANKIVWVLSAWRF